MSSLSFNARHHAGYIAALEGVGEDIENVGHGLQRRGIAGVGQEHNIRIFCSGSHHVGLVAIAVGNDDLAALLKQGRQRCRSRSHLRDVVLKDRLIFLDTQVGHGAFDSLDMGHVITGVLVMYENNADFQISRGDGLAGLAGDGPSGAAVGSLAAAVGSAGAAVGSSVVGVEQATMVRTITSANAIASNFFIW